ncbi:MAG: hypothetical protein ABIQ86_07430 [Steroidobacteraceae bacterium]
MHNEHDNLKAAELLVAQRLRNVPLRRAPASLQANVMAAIAAGTLQPGKVGHPAPWYRGDFRRWPSQVQILFALGCVALAWLLTQPLTGVTNAAPALLAGDELRSSWSVMQAVATVIASLADSLPALLRAMPTTLLMIVASMAVTAYSLLVGASALVYRSIRR